MDETLRIGTFNVKRLGARDDTRIDAIAELVRAHSLGVLALQEIEAGASLAIAERAGFPHASFVAHAQGAERGVAILHRVPALEHTGARVPARWRDDKGFTRVLVPSRSGPVEIVALHLDWLSRARRERQIASIGALLGEATGPRLVLGDLNAMSPRAFGGAHDDTAHALARVLGLRVRESSPPTFPSARPRWALDWILTCAAFETRQTQVVPTPLSDHAMLIADLAPARVSRAA
jgi:endonuclease/exonuclease/phosphatase family metal-dependent hydrolase